MPPRVMFIGLDAAEATLIDEWAARGELPAFARLKEAAQELRLGNPMDTLPGGIWPEIGSGRAAGKTGLFFHPNQLRTGEARLRILEPDEIDPSDDFWIVASRAGKRVAAIDIPQVVISPELNGIQITEWGLHDRTFAITSSPPELIEEVRERHGDHPVESCDDHGMSTAGYDRLLAGLREGIAKKTELLLELLDREEYDLFACVYSETHCVGHQFWHFRDPDARGHYAGAPQRFRDAMLDVYREVDVGVGQLLDAVGDETTVVVVTSHGMGPYLGGPHLLPEVLARLGLSSVPDTRLRRIARHAHNSARRLPLPIKRLAWKLREIRGLRRAQESIGASIEPLESPATRAAVLYNNRCGAIRLNLAGREPFGRVQPGAEADALLDELREELLALRDPDSGEPIVAEVKSAEEEFGSERHPDLPDLMVVFRRDIGSIEACRSPRVGTIRMPIYTNRSPRFGDHTDETRLWLRGTGFEPGVYDAEAHVLDIAPTILECLGVPVPEHLDGRPIRSAALA